MPSSATPSATSFAQEEMDLGEFGGDVIGERTDDDDSDVDVFDKQPKKRQRRAADRNVALLKIKAVVVISILLQSSNERCNFLQGWMGFFMNLLSIYNAVSSILKEISVKIKKEVHTLHAVFAYDNFDIAFTMAQPTLENRSTFVSATSATVIPLNGVDESNRDVLQSSAALWA
ncbi:hypothetical protein PAXRUDRAFT_14769 [Paxillus rubicundulus Ve08.2h10]|uniref:Unplaced genomic scaffold scaffold_816, whole genome shotgun sequence n=1 Tax=Paxillus rubicundulus Ve08.2h10 TaxID=930991 RepID=A0A0D0CI17_9AGAM|nr:hypothetical protein PAXRUDRAFT_14769 [Paxillus rubicundulus Ve08.2h10]